MSIASKASKEMKTLLSVLCKKKPKVIKALSFYGVAITITYRCEGKKNSDIQISISKAAF